MAALPGPSGTESAGAMGRADEARGQAESSQKIEDLMEMVKKLQKAGSLEPRVEVLINRINEVQQAKKKASEELGEARTVWEALQKELDSLSGEKVHLKEILSKKQAFHRTPRDPAHLPLPKPHALMGSVAPSLPPPAETLRTLRLHCQEKEAEAQRKQTMLQECKDRISALNSQIEEEKNKQRQLRSQSGWPWRLVPWTAARSSCSRKLVEAKLEDVKHRLCSQFGATGCSTITEGLFLRSQEAAAVVHLFEEENRKAQELLEAAAQRQEQLQQKCQQLQQKRQRLKEELEKLGVQVPAQGQSKQEEGAGPGEAANPKPLGVSEEKDPELPTKQGLMPS
ncbi:synaptonemal complex central element protein 1 isoform X3 [Camelus bactrianus]|uniref:Synaptonemal complex central element protein 1 isoform X3 n=2 Tax=Camelus TaxID=9836 RepID=A0AC58R4F4_CAMBA